jgi:membrane associated rhomboid family serine protease
VIPLKDDNPSHRFPFVTLVLVLANIVAFLYELLGGTSGAEQVIASLAFVPYEFVNRTDLPPASAVPIPLTLFTSMFLHAGWLHLGGNMLYLWIFGNNVEEEFGVFRFLLFYLFSGVVAALAHVVTAPGSTIPVVGASGAVAGVLGAYLVLYPHARVLTLVPILFFIRLLWLPSILLLGLWFVLQVLEGLPTLGLAEKAGVAWFAHIGGFLTGIVVGLVARRRRRAVRRPLDIFDEFTG